VVYLRRAFARDVVSRWRHTITSSGRRTITSPPFFVVLRIIRQHHIAGLDFLINKSRMKCPVLFIT